MGLISVPKTWVDNETLTYTDLNTTVSTVYNEVNGNIENANIKSSAAIEESKIAFSTASGHSHNGTDSKQIKSLAQVERARYGVLSTGTNVVPRWYNKTGLTLTLNRVFVFVETAPTGANLILDVNKNGTSIYNVNTGNRPTITAGQTSATSGAPDTTAIADGDYLTFDLDQVGSTVPGSDLLIVVYF